MVVGAVTLPAQGDGGGGGGTVSILRFPFASAVEPTTITLYAEFSSGVRNKNIQKIYHKSLL